ncbi:MAG: hypothetical protein WA087_01630 [Candidatus Saccharimonadales bacterium]
MNQETLSPVKAEIQEAKQIGPNTIHRFGAIAAEKAIDLTTYLEAADKATGEKLIDGELYKVSAKKEKEISTANLEGRTGLSLLAEDDKGNRFVYVQEYSEKGFDALRENLYSIPKTAEIKRAVILTPEGQKKGDFSKNDEFLDHLSLIIEHSALQKNHDKESPVVQVLTYPKEQSPQDFNEPMLRLNCLKDGKTDIYYGEDLVDPDY